MRWFVYALTASAGLAASADITSRGISSAIFQLAKSFLCLPIRLQPGQLPPRQSSSPTTVSGFHCAGFAPEQDYKWITREFSGRRLDPTRPEESLLLRKATGQTPHEGGRVFAPGSREYELLLAWIKSGFPGPSPNEPKINKLELTPISKFSNQVRKSSSLPRQHLSTEANAM